MNSSLRAAAFWAIPAASALGILGWFLLTPSPSASKVDSSPGDRNPLSSEEPAGRASSTLPDAGSVVLPPASGAPKGGATELPRYEGPVRDRARADRLREALGAMIASQHGEGGSGAMPRPVGDGNQADEALGGYVQSVMQEQFVPLAGSCYDALLERIPEARGNVVLDFSILGDRAVGGVVVDVSLGVDGKLSGEEFSTCLRESMFAVVFAAPPDGHRSVTVKQSFELAP